MYQRAGLKKKKKKTVYVWYVLGAFKIQLQVELLLPVFLCSLRKQLQSSSKACTDMLGATVNEMQYDAITFVRNRIKAPFV